MRRIRSPLSDITIPQDVSLSDFVLRQIEDYGEKTALVDGITGRSMTYAQVRHQAYRLGSALWGQYGLTKGQVVGLILPNCIEYIVFVHGILLTGATVTAYNPTYTKGELRHQIIESNTSVIVTNKAVLHKVISAAEGLTHIQGIIVLDEEKSTNEYISYSDLLTLHNGLTLPQVDINPLEDVAILLYSSGTTGKPKGVMLTHYNCITCICQFNHPSLKLSGPDEVLLVVIPAFHVFGLNVILQTGIYSGSELILLPKFEPETYFRCIETYKVTVLPVAPPIVVFLAQHPLVDKFNTNSVHTIFSGGAPLPEQVAEAAHRRLPGAAIQQGYGMTEAAPGTLVTLTGSRPFSSIGVPMSNTEVKVEDITTGDALPAGEIGELCARGPQVMKGYLNNSKATRETVDNEGWLHTGDLGYYTEEGVFYIVDRVKELIKYKAFQVAPAELESLLLTHPAVKDAAVVGRPDLGAGELPTAFIVTGASVTSDDLIQFVKDKVAPHKQLRGGVIFVDTIPRSPSGKILRRLLKEKLVSKSKL